MEDKNAAQENLIDAFVEKFGLIENKVPSEMLFHYTSNGVLLKIIQNKCLWMTHALFMNDSSEFSHGMTKFRNELDAFEKKNIERAWLDKIREFFDQEMKDPRAQPFVFSMTENPDQLSQWRGYGDDARGVSIGIKSSELALVDGLHFKNLNVIYDHAVQERIVKSVADGFLETIKSMDKETLDDGIVWGPKLALGYFQASYLQSIRFKHSSWSEEKEWRAIVLAGEKNSATFSRTRGSELVRCYNLPISNLQKLIGKIVIGPRAERKTQRVALESIRANGEFNFEIVGSNIPMKP